jgi:hypothetical protein
VRIPVLLVALGGAAGAEPLEILDGQARWGIELPDGFSAEETEELGEGTMLARFSDPAGRRVVVARLRGNTDGAYDGARSYFAGLEEGVKAQTPGYRRLASAQRKLGKKGKIPAFDLWFRAKGAVRGSRFVLLKGYALVLTVDAPSARRVDRALKKALESFAPMR